MPPFEYAFWTTTSIVNIVRSMRVHPLEERDAQAAAAADDAVADLALAERALAAGEDERLVRRAHVEERCAR